MRCLPRVAVAQAYPTRLVRILVGVAAGGSTDIVAGVIGQWLSERLGQQFVVDNRPGVGTNIATEQVVKAAPDGYTLLMVAASMRALVLREAISSRTPRPLADTTDARPRR